MDASAEPEPDYGACDPTPPGVVLRSPAGDQLGGFASYCAGCQLPDSGETNYRCADGPTSIQSYSIVHPGDALSISMPDGTLVAGAGCKPECPPSIRIRDEVCPNNATIGFEVSEDSTFSVELAPGRYRLELSAYFEAEGKGGSTGAGFGLIVDPARKREVVSAATAPALRPCVEPPPNTGDEDAG